LELTLAVVSTVLVEDTLAPLLVLREEVVVVPFELVPGHVRRKGLIGLEVEHDFADGETPVIEVAWLCPSVEACKRMRDVWEQVPAHFHRSFASCR
jgi:hypothetical protein